MRLNIVCIGKTDQKLVREQLEYYAARLPKHWHFQIIEIPDLKNAKNLSPEQIKKEEAKLFFQYIDPQDFITILDEKGKHLTSREFAHQIQHWQNTATKRVCFLIGGAYGFAEEIYQRAQYTLALSKMTFTHQMVRLFLTEQIYRADQILQGKPYHND